MAWARFQEINLPVADVGKKLGGHVEMNISSGIFENACPIRMSYVLNRTGIIIPGGGYQVVSGADKHHYIFHVRDMIRFLTATLGRPDKTVRSPKPTDFSGLKGLLVIVGHGWGNASGHVTLWDGTSCADSCHMMADPDNGRFVPEVGYLWVLP